MSNHPPIPMATLEAKFLVAIVKNNEHWGHRVVESINEAQGVKFLCPLCFHRNNGSVGTHMVICWSENRGTPPFVRPFPARWGLQGTSINDLTLEGENGRSNSVAILGGCAWHGFVDNGIAHE